MRTIELTRQYDNGHTITFDMSSAGTALVAIDNNPDWPQQIILDTINPKIKMDCIIRETFQQTEVNCISEEEVLQEECCDQEIPYGTIIAIYCGNGLEQKYRLTYIGKSVEHNGMIAAYDWQQQLWTQWKHLYQSEKID